MSFYSEKTNNIQFTKDVIDELEKRTGKRREILEDIFAINIKYIHETVNSTEEVIINFPKLGKYRLNYYFIMAFYSVVKRADVKRRVKERIDRLKAIIHKSNNLRNFNKPNLYLMYKTVTKDYQTSVMKNFYKCWSIVEENHNKTHAKYFKKS